MKKPKQVNEVMERRQDIMTRGAGEPPAKQAGSVTLAWRPETEPKAEVAAARLIRNTMGRPSDYWQYNTRTDQWAFEWVAANHAELKRLVARAQKLTGVKVRIFAQDKADYPDNAPRPRYRRGTALSDRWI